MKSLDRTIEKYKLIQKGDKVLVALSGGADSVCLLALLAQRREKLGIALAAAHFSHGIRPECAEEERELCTRLCQRLGVPFFHGGGDTPAWAAARGVGLEEGARELRYAFLHRTLEEWQGDVIATAHNRSDNAETALFNLVRGSGLQGMGGIKPRNGLVIRPLIETSRSDIEGYIAAKDLPFVTDMSNFDQQYTRNRLRAQVLPVLREINPGADRHILEFSEVAAQAADFLRLQAGELLGKHKKISGAISVPCGIVAEAHPALHYYIFAGLYELAGGQPGALSAAHIEALRELLASHDPSAQLSMPGRITARRIYDHVIFEKGELCGQEPDTELPEGQEICWRGWSIKAGGEEGFSFSAEKVVFPLTVGTRRQGDRINLPGGGKTVKKLMIERKIPAKNRDNIPLVWDNNGVLLVGDWAQDAARLPKGDKDNIVKINIRRP